MSSVSTDRIEKALGGLAEDQLRQVYEFVAFLAGSKVVEEPGDDPDATSKAGAMADISVSFLLRFAFGDLEFPDEPEVTATRYKPLPVELRPQKKSRWCWASSTEMITAHHGKKVTQEQQGGSANKPGWPAFELYEFEADVLKDGAVLSREAVRREIDENRPFAISWVHQSVGKTARKTGHMLVVSGYVHINDELWLVALDPWPPGSGDKSLIAYDFYVKGRAGSWRTYYNIRPRTQ